MIHCDEIVAIGISERIGGKDGHNLLLASVKSSLPFSFLNGASSYAGFCSRLLLEHYQAGLFHKNFKQSLYTLPYDDSNVNFGLDTLREIDHRSAKKCIRPGSTLETLLPKMSTVDKQKQLHAVRKSIVYGQTVGDDDIDKVDNKAVKSSASKYLGKRLSASDKEHIGRTIKLMLRQNAFHTEKDLIPRNIYHSNLPEVSTVILDKNTYDVGRYLIKRFACDKKYLDLTQEDYPSLEEMNGPKELISRVKRNQSVTIKRTTCKPKNKPKTDRDREEKAANSKSKKLYKRIIICEEKYAFTPNDFKVNTRQKRKKKEKVTISHLKEDQEIFSSEYFCKQAVVGTMAGKILISRYLATQMQHLKIKADLEINVDSEAYTSKCNCQKEHDESCSRYTVPVRVMYNKQTGYVKEGFIDEVKQRMERLKWPRQTGYWMLTYKKA
ncbi:unnamed protein product [Mytilus coruscus]|uniref:Uncharacterized protein n=1 Tax=Mytilus coruscus TaxID=42192 RepID=A0A6J8DQ62_MYTCO|nr:unnamed protein product [Mytilus coruscus]